MAAYFPTLYYFQMLEKHHKLGKYIGSIETEIKLNNLLLSDEYGKTLVSLNLQDLDYPEVGKDNILYNDDDLCLFVLNPNDPRVGHPAFASLCVPSPTCVFHYTMYPHPSLGFDESGLYGADGLIFSWDADGNEVHVPYDISLSNPALGRGGLSKMYVAIVPIVAPALFKTMSCRFWIKKGSAIPAEKRAECLSLVSSVMFPNAGDELVLPSDPAEYPLFVDDTLLLYPLDCVLRDGEEFFVFCVDFLQDGEHNPIASAEALWETAERLFAERLEIKRVAAVMDRYFGKSFSPYDRKKKGQRRTPEQVIKPTVPDYLFRNPFGMLAAIPTFASFQFPPFLKLLHFPLDIATESIMGAEMERRRWSGVLVDDGGLPVSVDASELADLFDEGESSSERASSSGSAESGKQAGGGSDDLSDFFSV